MVKNKKTKKDNSYAWISLILLLFLWVPILNVFLIIPASLFFSTTALIRARRSPEKYGGFAFALILVTVAALCWIAAFIMLIKTSKIG